MSMFSGGSSHRGSGSGIFSGSPKSSRPKTSLSKTRIYGDKDYGLAGKHPVKTGPYFTAPRTGRPHTTVQAALKDGFCTSQTELAQTVPCTGCNGNPQNYEFLMKRPCPTCGGLGRIPIPKF